MVFCPMCLKDVPFQGEYSYLCHNCRYEFSLEDSIYTDVGFFRLVIAGSRGFKHYSFLKEKVDYLIHKRLEEGFVPIIISGMAKGADRIGAKYAKEREYVLKECPADWDTYGKSAGYRRNVEMADMADAVIVFWDGVSKGSDHMIQIAKDKGIPVKVINF